jgi:hypothetical protein
MPVAAALLWMSLQLVSSEVSRVEEKLISSGSARALDVALESLLVLTGQTSFT